MKPKIHNLTAQQLLIVSATQHGKPIKEPILLHPRRRDWRALYGAVVLACVLSGIYLFFRILEEASR